MWREMTEADLLQRISGTELDIMREALLADNQPDPVADQIKLTTNYARGFIVAWKKNKLGADGTLPDSLILPAADICIVDLNTRAGGLLVDDSKERSRAKATAIAMLRNDVATGKFTIEDPDTGISSPSSGGSTLLKHNTPRFNRDNLKGF